MRKKHKLFSEIVIVLSLLLLPSISTASEMLSKSAGDTLWLVTAGALVFLMQAGFALLEGGMSRSKNAINVIMKNYSDVCFGSLAFFAVGFGLMFGENESGFFGTTGFFFASDNPMDYSLLFFQTMFAATAATIVSGAMAERTRFNAYLIVAVVIMGLIYPVYGSWVWGSLFEGKGWLANMGFIDFAGSTVVHSIGAWCALAGIIVVGPRLGRFTKNGMSHPIQGHNLTLVALGGFLLWFGWFGFNAGSTAAADLSIGMIALNTHLAASAGLVGAMLSMRQQRVPILMTNLVNGSLGGLVGITAGCATMSPGFAIFTGLVSGFIVVKGNLWLEKKRLDDVVGAVPVHGFCGAWGTLAAGFFVQGDLFNFSQLGVQAIGVAMAFAWSFPITYGIFKFLDSRGVLRSPSDHEQHGLDYSEHAELGYPEFQQHALHKPLGEL